MQVHSPVVLVVDLEGCFVSDAHDKAVRDAAWQVVSGLDRLRDRVGETEWGFRFFRSTFHRHETPEASQGSDPKPRPEGQTAISDGEWRPTPAQCAWLAVQPC